MLTLKEKEPKDIQVVQFFGYNLSQILTFVNQHTPNDYWGEFSIEGGLGRNKSSLRMLLNISNKEKFELKINEFLCYDGRHFFKRNLNQLRQKYDGI